MQLTSGQISSNFSAVIATGVMRSESCSRQYIASLGRGIREFVIVVGECSIEIIDGVWKMTRNWRFEYSGRDVTVPVE
jgi:hypothetical protein